MIKTQGRLENEAEIEGLTNVQQNQGGDKLGP